MSAEEAKGPSPACSPVLYRRLTPRSSAPSHSRAPTAPVASLSPAANTAPTRSSGAWAFGQSAAPPRPDARVLSQVPVCAGPGGREPWLQRGRPLFPPRHSIRLRGNHPGRPRHHPGPCRLPHARCPVSEPERGLLFPLAGADSRRRAHVEATLPRQDGRPGRPRHHRHLAVHPQDSSQGDQQHRQGRVAHRRRRLAAGKPGHEPPAAVALRLRRRDAPSAHGAHAHEQGTGPHP